MGIVRGYARTANSEGDIHQQFEALKAAGCAEIYFDIIHSGLERGPELKKVLALRSKVWFRRTICFVRSKLRSTFRLAGKRETESGGRPLHLPPEKIDTLEYIN